MPLLEGAFCLQLNNPSAALPCYPQTVKEEISVLAELPLYIREDEAPDLYKMSAEDGVEVGPFTVSSGFVC